MKFSYADPPYLGCGKLYTDHHPDALVWDRVETHEALIAQMRDESPDGWAVSLHTPSLEEYAHIARRVLGPNQVRWGYWLKTFASFKPNVNPGYAWEPIMWRGGRRQRSRDEDTVRDFCAVGITLRKGLTGVKPDPFCHWLFDLAGLQEGDELADLFPGSGAVSAAWDSYRRQRRFA